jgi:hypothetical protein
MKTIRLMFLPKLYQLLFNSEKAPEPTKVTDMITRKSFGNVNEKLL